MWVTKDSCRTQPTTTSSTQTNKHFTPPSVAQKSNGTREVAPLLVLFACAFVQAVERCGAVEESAFRKPHFSNAMTQVAHGRGQA